MLRIRVRLPDRPGSLGKVARVLGVLGADIVQVTVLERDGGRALDDFTVVWPAGGGIDRVCEGLASVPGVDIVGIWPTAEPQGAFPDAALIGQLARNPREGLCILVDAVPGILSADWAGLVGFPARPASGGPDLPVGRLVYAGTGPLVGMEIPDVTPLRPRSFLSPDGVQYAVAPIAGGALAILVARTGAPRFHRTEVFRLAQLVGAAEAVLGADPLASIEPAGRR